MGLKIGGVPFTEREVMVVIPSLRAAGFSWNRVAQAMGRTSGKAVRFRFEKEQDRQRSAAGIKRRACKRCHEPFDSPHCGVRMCDPCRVDDTSPFEPEPA